MQNVKSVPRESWVILFWDVETECWSLAETWAHDEESSARGRRDRYRRELGAARVRMVHTADG